MNKNFFAKYLPVEGEVLEGDKYLDSLVPWVKKPLTHSGTVYYDDQLNGTLRNPVIQSVEGTTSPKNCTKKVNLFLCTRDIQVGDKVFWQNPEGTVSAWLTVVAKHDGECRLTGVSETGTCRQEIYKPVGEITAPRSVHIDEGDEFNIDEARKLVSVGL